MQRVNYRLKLFLLLLCPFLLETLELCFQCHQYFLGYFITCSNDIKLIPKINTIIERLASQINNKDTLLEILFNTLVVGRGRSRRPIN